MSVCSREMNRSICSSKLIAEEIAADANVLLLHIRMIPAYCLKLHVSVTTPPDIVLRI